MKAHAAEMIVTVKIKLPSPERAARDQQFENFALVLIVSGEELVS